MVRSSKNWYIEGKMFLTMMLYTEQWLRRKLWSVYGSSVTVTVESQLWTNIQQLVSGHWTASTDGNQRMPWPWVVWISRLNEDFLLALTCSVTTGIRTIFVGHVTYSDHLQTAFITSLTLHSKRDTLRMQRDSHTRLDNAFMWRKKTRQKSNCPWFW